MLVRWLSQCFPGGFSVTGAEGTKPLLPHASDEDVSTLCDEFEALLMDANAEVQACCDELSGLLRSHDKQDKNMKGEAEKLEKELKEINGVAEAKRQDLMALFSQVEEDSAMPKMGAPLLKQIRAQVDALKLHYESHFNSIRAKVSALKGALPPHSTMLGTQLG